MNLNEMVPDQDGNFPPPHRSKTVAAATCVSHFDNLEQSLVALIQKHECVFGCVAWLTSEPILSACRNKDAHFIVQKEDFLRPDHVGKQALRALYDALEVAGGRPRFRYPGLVGSLSVASDPHFAAVRCVGNHNADRNPAFPRMHHKFAVFGDWICDSPSCPGDCPECRLDLACVWTGSFNFTRNAGVSLENAVVIYDPVIVGAYYDEFAYIASLSEPLDWDTAWSSPQWRVGT